MENYRVYVFNLTVIGRINGFLSNRVDISRKRRNEKRNGSKKWSANRSIVHILYFNAKVQTIAYRSNDSRPRSTASINRSSRFLSYTFPMDVTCPLCEIYRYRSEIRPRFQDSRQTIPDLMHTNYTILWRAYKIIGNRQILLLHRKSYSPRTYASQWASFTRSESNLVHDFTIS